MESSYYSSEIKKVWYRQNLNLRTTSLKFCWTLRLFRAVLAGFKYFIQWVTFFKINWIFPWLPTVTWPFTKISNGAYYSHCLNEKPHNWVCFCSNGKQFTFTMEGSCFYYSVLSPLNSKGVPAVWALACRFTISGRQATAKNQQSWFEEREYFAITKTELNKATIWIVYHE